MPQPPFFVGAPLLAVALLMAGLNGPAAAQAPAPAAQGTAPSSVAWGSLSLAQRQALKPLERDWNGIDATRKQKWLEIASRFDRMAPEERGRVQQRMSEWVRLSPKQRNEARQNFQGAKELSTEERQARWQAYKELPEEQRRGLAARARAGAGPAAAAAPRAAGFPKVNTVPNPLLEARRSRAVTPAVVQARPGATTNLISTRPAPPLHQQPGLPKVAATPEFVDSTTLLPQRGPQGAAADSRRRP